MIRCEIIVKTVAIKPNADSVAVETRWTGNASPAEENMAKLIDAGIRAMTVLISSKESGGFVIEGKDIESAIAAAYERERSE